jgi:hypothetical protein
MGQKPSRPVDLRAKLRASSERIKIHAAKERNEVARLEADILKCLISRSLSKALSHAKHAVTTRNLTAAKALLQDLCEELDTRLGLVCTGESVLGTRDGKVPAELLEVVHTLAWAARQFEAVPELAHVRNILGSVFKEVRVAAEDAPGARINATIRARVGAIFAPTAEEITAELVAVAAKNNVPFDAKKDLADTAMPVLATPPESGALFAPPQGGEGGGGTVGGGNAAATAFGGLADPVLVANAPVILPAAVPIVQPGVLQLPPGVPLQPGVYVAMQPQPAGPYPYQPGMAPPFPAGGPPLMLQQPMPFPLPAPYPPQPQGPSVQEIAALVSRVSALETAVAGGGSGGTGGGSDGYKIDGGGGDAPAAFGGSGGAAACGEETLPVAPVVTAPASDDAPAPTSAFAARLAALRN